MALLLVVDDEIHIRETVAAALRRDGHEVIAAASTLDGWSHIEQKLPDLIISDICMDEGDGLEFLQSIRTNPRTGAIPFIIMTGHPDPSSMTQGIESAADGYIAKPFSLDTLRKAVRSRLGREALLRRDASEIKTQLYRVLQAAPELIALADPETLGLFFLNSAGRKMLETGDEFARPLTDFFLPAIAADFGQVLAASIRDGHWRGETVLVPPSGRRIPVQLLLQSHRRHDGKTEYLSVLARDLTEQHENERALRASEFRFRCLVDSLPDAVLMCRKDGGKITFFNSRTAELLGYSHQELMNLEAGSLFGTALPPSASKDNIGGKHAQSPSEYNITRKSGESLPASVFVERLEIEGEPVDLCIIHDLTSRRRIERERQEIELQLRQAQKLESIGQLAAGIAHEINTPTQYIGDNTRFLQDAFQQFLAILGSYQELAAAIPPENPLSQRARAIEEEAGRLDLAYLVQEIPSAIKQSLEGIDRVTKIVGAMKDFSHPHATEKSLVDINHAIENTVTVARNEWKYVAELETDFDPELPLVPCLPGEFNQVILNLIVNAAHAIGDVVCGAEAKGLIRISTAVSGEWVEIRVRDTGPGIPEDIRPKIFEPFFTTKEIGKGTGQGLAISRSVIVDKHGGSLTFETEPGKGATFIIRLPKTSAA